jgi:protein TonB
MPGRDSRVFHYAVIASIALHAVALLIAPSLREISRRIEWPGPIVARLVEAQQPPAATPAVEPAVKPEAKPAVQPAVKPVPSPRPAPVVEAAPQAPSRPAPEAPVAPAPAAEPAQAVASQAAPAAAPAARPGAEVDADSVGRFRLLVIEEAKKLKRYPRAARDNNWEGRANVRVTYGRDGRRASVLIVRSSGHEVLDREALDTVAKADVAVPAALRGKEFAFEIEVIFNLSESTSG